MLAIALPGKLSARFTSSRKRRSFFRSDSFGRADVQAKIFGGRVEDEAHATKVMEDHNSEVIGTLPPDRLLVFEATDGWPKLCDFLDVPVPPNPYPHSNTISDFQARFVR